MGHCPRRHRARQRCLIVAMPDSRTVVLQVEVNKKFVPRYGSVSRRILGGHSRASDCLHLKSDQLTVTQRLSVDTRTDCTGPIFADLNEGILQRHIEIIDSRLDEQVVTAIEFLSPANKNSLEDRPAYQIRTRSAGDKYSGSLGSMSKAS